MKNEKDYIAAKAKLDDYVDAHHMRHTQEREMLLKALCEMEQPFAVKALLASAEEQHISQGTVYNTLALLVSAQILHCVKRGYGREQAEYELLTNAQTHLELVCRRCGRVAKFKDVAIENLVRARKYSNFTLRSFSLYVYGECKTCKRKIKNNN